MVGIITLKGSPVDLVNAGLTAREYIKSGKAVKFQQISEEELKEFWKRPLDYADPEDKTLVIINVPLPSIKVLKNMESNAWEAAIIYVPSKLVSMDKDSRNVLLEKGISCTPQREPYLCFAGDFEEATDEFWMSIAKILSLESIPEEIGREKTQAISGLLMATHQAPQVAAEKISENDREYFIGLAKEESPTEVYVDDPDMFVGGVIDSERAILPDIACEAFDAYLRTKKKSIGICGAQESAVFSIKPTCTKIHFKECDVISYIFYRLGKGAIFTVDQNQPAHIGALVGRDARYDIIINFSEPKFVKYKTLKRRLVGGYTSSRERDKVYRKRYHGLKETYPEIRLLGKRIIKVSPDAFEMVVDTLNECGSKFKVFC